MQKAPGPFNTEISKRGVWNRFASGKWWSPQALEALMVCFWEVPSYPLGLLHGLEDIFCRRPDMLTHDLAGGFGVSFLEGLDDSGVILDGARQNLLGPFNGDVIEKTNL
jgi:hypothetical protein